MVLPINDLDNYLKSLVSPKDLYILKQTVMDLSRTDKKKPIIMYIYGSGRNGKTTFVNSVFQNAKRVKTYVINDGDINSYVNNETKIIIVNDIVSLKDLRLILDYALIYKKDVIIEYNIKLRLRELAKKFDLREFHFSNEF